MSELSDQKQRWLERVAVLFGACVVGGAIWYWLAQVRSVLEVLEMAYG